MKRTEQTLLEHLKINRHDIEQRKASFDITEDDIRTLKSLRTLVAENIDEIVDEFYKQILRIDELDRVIGDSETLHRLKNHQRHYVLALFSGRYDEDYVHSRLRVGVVHNRIGLDAKFYIMAVHNMIDILQRLISANIRNNCQSCTSSILTVKKIMMFDLSLTLDTYINSLIDEARRSKDALEAYTQSLEETISERTRLLKEQARNDGLTGLLNQRAFYRELRRELSRGQRRNHATTLVYFDLDGFKQFNDSQGHQSGDDILVATAETLREELRDSDRAARYGGDEFCIILPETTLQDGAHVCERVSAALEKAFRDTGVSCSMGMAASTAEHSLDTEALVKAADAAMYRAKRVSGFSVVTANGEQPAQSEVTA